MAFNVFDVAAPDLPVLVQDRRVDPGVLLVAVLVLRWHILVLACLPRCSPLVAGAPAQGRGEQLVPLVGEERLDILHHKPAREAALLLLDTDHPLNSMSNVVLTPHIGGATYDTEANHSRLIADDLSRLLEGERPLHIVNPEVLK